MRVQTKLRGMISLSAKAGKVRSGETAVRAAARKGEAALLLAEETASTNTKSTMDKLAAAYALPLLTCRIWAHASASPEGPWPRCATRALPRRLPGSTTNTGV